MHHPHPYDEFSVTDLRHTVAEIWRVVADRRWWFVVPCCLATTAALLASHLLPREYRASTRFERRRDTVLANMGRGWAESVEALRATIADDLKYPDLWKAVLDELDPPRGSPPVIAHSRSELASTLLAGLTVSVTPSDDRDVIALELRGRDMTIRPLSPQALPAVLAAVRERYIETARRRTLDLLHRARDFFQTETDRAAARLAEAEAAVRRLETSYPGLPLLVGTAEAGAQKRGLDGSRATDPLIGAPPSAVIALQREARDLEQRIAALDRRTQEARDRIAAQTAAAANPSARQVTVQPRDAAKPPSSVALLEADLDRARRDLWDARNLRGMTDLHPTVIALSAKIARLQDELQRVLPPAPAHEDPADDPPAANAVPYPGATVTRSPHLAPSAAGSATPLSAALSDMQRESAELGQRRAQIAAEIDDWRCRLAEADEHRDEYAAALDRAGAARAEVDAWSKNLAPLDRVLTVQNSNRGVLFSVIEEPAPVVRPVWPAARKLLIVCLGIGIAVGVLCVVVAELADRSFRTMAQLTAAIRLPVIEGIDEIVTQETRRRRMFRRLVLVPTTLALLMGMTGLAAAAAWVSLEHPRSWQPWRAPTVEQTADH